MCLLAILLGVLFAWQLLLPSAASAEHRAVTGVTTAFPDKQGVSVVRLLVTYSKQGSDPSVSCTGVGAIVGSWTAVGPDDPTLMNTWILTDQDLLNQHSPSCGKAGGGIESVTVLPSATFTGPFQAVATATPLASVQLSSAS
ncbi:MAG TPA: hypothetical protein VFN23_02455, partial [Ktedonobacteraceae bacterium]|nr:hypothetical protein [Ktedonobacteraceae bacterium]